MEKITYRINNHSSSVKVNELSHLCPYHRKEIDPEIVTANENTNTLEVLFKCPNKSCNRTYFSIYKRLNSVSENRLVGSNAFYTLQRTYPTSVDGADLASCIITISPNLEKIINQAKAAEKYGLDELSGMGYRKALEFLIKDYCSHISPDDKAIIETELLGLVINNRITNDSIKTIALRTAWIGNDQTHYSKKWEDKDIEDLKVLLDITIKWIEYEVTAKEQISSMPTKKQKPSN